VTHKQPSAVAGPIYTGPGRTRLAPQAGIRGVVPALLVCHPRGRELRWVGPRRLPAPRMSGSSSATSQPSALAHLPSGISTRLEGGTEMAPHGVLDTYVNHGCRCAALHQGLREYGRRRARLRAYGQLESSSRRDGRRHIAWLSTQGVGWGRIASLANVGRTTVEQITLP
jgi:hypothetical protein